MDHLQFAQKQQKGGSKLAQRQPQIHMDLPNGTVVKNRFK